MPTEIPKAPEPVEDFKGTQFLNELFEKPKQSDADPDKAKADRIFEEFQEHKALVNRERIKQQIEDTRGEFDDKIVINSYLDVARLYCKYIKLIRIIQGAVQDKNLKIILGYFDEMKCIEEYVYRTDNADYIKGSPMLMKKIIVFENTILDFVGWIRGLMSDYTETEKEEEDYGF